MNSAAITEWLLDEGRLKPGMPELIKALAHRLNEDGLALARMSSSYQTLHPELASLAYLWTAGDDHVQTIEIDLERQSSNDYLMSPVRVIYDGGQMVRCRLEGDDPDLEYRFLERLRDDGFTDYAVMAVPQSDGGQLPFTIATKRKGGFSDAEITGLQTILPTFGLLVEVHAGRHLAQSLLDVYLGHGTGERVLAGAVRRGSVHRYRAAICFCDLRGFTALSETLQRNHIVHVLNDYFGAVGEAIDAHGGEILKFIGDAALVIFPVDQGTDAEACERALAAARDMMAQLARLNERRAAENKHALEIGMGLHVGEVWYGNIGTANRLDFTVIGPAVNRAARLEKLAADLHEPLLVSQAFAEESGADFTSVGLHALKGIAEPTEAFRPN